MVITGKNFIGNQLSAKGSESYKTYNPSKNIDNETVFVEATTEEIDEAAALAETAFITYSEMPGVKRAAFLNAIADEILNLGTALVDIYCEETGLPEGRAVGERGRTVFQLQLFAKMIASEDWRNIVSEKALPERTPLPKPSLQKTHIPLGPIAVFGASNFPLAYSTAGGDTASALAAGCPVIVKSHPMHSGTGALVASAILKAAEDTGMPNGVFSNINSKSYARAHALVSHPKIKGVGFTGSFLGGSSLQESVWKREEPIPFFAEMGSINPIAIMPGSIAENHKEVAQKIAGSMVLGVGQFCTQPGLILVMEGGKTDDFIEALEIALSKTEQQCMIHPNLKQNYIQQSDKINDLNGTKVIKTEREIPDDTFVYPKLSLVSGDQFLKDKQYQEEVFGPFSLIVKCKNTKELEAVTHSLKGQLTGSIFAQPSDYRLITPLIQIMKSKVGRFLFNDVPTGVEVSDAMTHGGPFPAASDSRFSAVGHGAIYRWVRPITYQNWPEELL